MIDLQSVKDSYKSFAVIDVALVESAYNVADAVNKIKASSI